MSSPESQQLPPLLQLPDMPLHLDNPERTLSRLDTHICLADCAIDAIMQREKIITESSGEQRYFDSRINCLESLIQEIRLNMFTLSEVIDRDDYDDTCDVELSIPIGSLDNEETWACFQDLVCTFTDRTDPEGQILVSSFRITKALSAQRNASIKSNIPGIRLQIDSDLSLVLQPEQVES